jgi:hypothetical protein
MFEVATAVLVEPPPTEIVISEEQTDKTDLIVLKGDFSSGDSSYKFELKSGGTGEIFYSDFANDSEEFAHEVKVEKLAAEIESIREEIFSEMLEEVFWEEINQTLEDPFFRSF